MQMMQWLRVCDDEEDCKHKLVYLGRGRYKCLRCGKVFDDYIEN